MKQNLLSILIPLILAATIPEAFKLIDTSEDQSVRIATKALLIVVLILMWVSTSFFLLWRRGQQELLRTEDALNFRDQCS